MLLDDSHVWLSMLIPYSCIQAAIRAVMYLSDYYLYAVYRSEYFLKHLTMGHMLCMYIHLLEVTKQQICMKYCSSVLYYQLLVSWSNVGHCVNLWFTSNKALD